MPSGWTDLYYDACDRYLAKAGGEGSHGGHVIGHTKSGRPIYEAGAHADERAFHSSTKKFSAQDHSDAMAAHLKAAKKHESSGNKIQAKLSHKAADEHEAIRNTQQSKAGWTAAQHRAQAKKYDSAADSLRGKGKMSRTWRASSKHRDDAMSLTDKAQIHHHLGAAG